MKKFISIILAAASIASLFYVTGCADPDESTIPWSRPKDWEGGVPGMGSS